MPDDLTAIAGPGDRSPSEFVIPAPAEPLAAQISKLRAAAAETLLAAGLVMAEIEGERRRQSWEQKPDCQRLLKAMEQLREALS